MVRPAHPKANTEDVTDPAPTATTEVANDVAPAVTTRQAKPGRLKRRKCTECGAEFYTRYKAYTCSDKCRRKRARRMGAKKVRSVTANKP
jgi:hypothetical protein